VKEISKIMHNEAVYYIKVKKISDPELEKELEKDVLVFFKSILSEKEANQYIAFGEEDYIFSFLSRHKTAQIIKFFSSKVLLDSYSEVSMDILLDRIKSDDFNVLYIKDDRFASMLDRFISKNLTVDLVLDKINERGSESLNKTDYEVLKKMADDK
jgi:hypothetical protein